LNGSGDVEKIIVQHETAGIAVKKEERSIAEAPSTHSPNSQLQNALIESV
jgi:hypothetical protein